MKFLLHAYYTPLFIFNNGMWIAIFFKAVLASSKVAFVAFVVPSLEIPGCS
jgi:hypothetical protein